MFALVMGGIVAGLRPISTSLFKINSCYLVVREQSMDYFYLDLPLSTYPPKLWKYDWLVKLYICPRTLRLLGLEWMLSRDICPQLLQPPQLFEEEWLVSRYLCPWIYFPKDTSRPSSSELSFPSLWKKEY